MIDAFYLLFGKHYVIVERTPNKNGTGFVGIPRRVPVFLSDPGFWFPFVLAALVGLIFVIKKLGSVWNSDLSVVWMWEWTALFVLSYVAAVWISFFLFSTIVRTDKQANRQMFGEGRIFMDTRVGRIPFITKFAFYPRKNQTVFSEDNLRNPTDEQRELILTSMMRQEVDYMEGFGVDVDLDGNLADLIGPDGKFIPRLAPGQRPGDEPAPYSENNVPHLLQYVKLRVLFRMATETQPKLMNERFFSPFHKHDLNPRYSAIDNDVRRDLMRLAMGPADEVMEQYSVHTANADVARINRALTARLTPLLRRVPVEVDSITAEIVTDPLDVQGYQYYNARKEQAKLKSKADQDISNAQRDARVVDATANQVATASEQQTRAENARNQALAEEEVLKANRIAAQASLQPLLVKLDELQKNDRQSAILYQKLTEMSPDELNELIVETAKALQPNLTNATLVGVNVLDLFPLFRFLNGLAQQLERRVGAGGGGVGPSSG